MKDCLKRHRHVLPTLTGRGCLLLPSWLILLGFLGLSRPITAHAQSASPVSVIDLLVLYTPQAAAGAGGTNQLLSQINLAVLEANLVFQNSHANARIHLVLTAGIDYTESGSVATDLAKLADPNDPDLGFAHQFRDKSGADLVCLITETGDDYDFYGLQGPSAENAFSILRQPFLTGGYFLPVTLSFNLGCQLERPFADSVGAFPYAYGYSFSVNNGGFYSTVDAFSGQRLPFFSNPNIIYQGSPAGVPPGMAGSADNVLVINQTAPIVAAFRGPAPLTVPPSVRITSPATNAAFVTGTNITLTAFASDSDGSVSRVDYYEYTDSSTNWIGSSTNQTQDFSVAWPLTMPGQYSLVAVATDNQSACTISTPVQIIVGPANDDFAASALMVGTNVIVSGDNTFATSEPGEPAHAGTPAAHSLWWNWTAPANGEVTLDATNGGDQIELAAYTGLTLGGLSVVSSNLATGDTAIRFQTTAGQNYQIAVDDPDGNTGTIQLALTFAPPVANDNFASRQVLTGTNLTITNDNRGATLEPGEPEHSGTPGCASLWYSWTAPANGQLEIDLSALGSGSFLLGVYTGNVLTNLTPASFQSGSPTTVQAGVTYQIAVDSPNDPRFPGPFSLTLNFNAVPANDTFSGRLTVTGSYVSVTNSSLLATVDPNDPANGNTGFPTLWFAWTAPAAGYVSISWPGWNGQFIDVFTGTQVTNLTSVTSGFTPSFTAIAGTTYDIAATGWPGDVILDLVLSTVQMTTPTNNSVLYVGNNYLLSATNSIVDSPLDQIEFFVDGNSIGAATNPPYSLMWTNVPTGNHAVTAVGESTNGPDRNSPPVSVNVIYPPPPNDNFTNPTVISGTWIDVTNSTLGSTAGPGEPEIGNLWWGKPMWWSWTAPASGRVTISDLASSFGEGFGIYTGNSLSNLVTVTSTDGNASFQAVAGTTYAIAATSGSDTLQFELVLSGLYVASPADGSVFVAGSNLPLTAGITAAEQPVSQVEFFATETLLGVVTKTSLGFVTNAPYTLIWTNIPSGAFSLTVAATDIFGHVRTSPSVSIQVHPANDDFANATILTGTNVHTTGNTTGANSQPQEPKNDGALSVGHSVWFSWVAPTTARYSVTVAPSWGNWAPMAVYTGSTVSSLTLVSSNAYWSVCAFTAQAGTTYSIAVDSDGNTGPFDLYITQPPTNDDFADRLTITNANTLVTGNNLGASSEPGEPLVAYYGGQSVWWTWTAPSSGQLSFTTYPLGSEPMLHIYTGSNVSNLALLPGQQGGPFDQINNLAFNVTGGVTYAISADGRWSNDWSIAFMLNFQPGPANDNFSNAIVLSGTNVTVSGDNTFATTDPGDPNGLIPTSNHSVWYSWTAPTSNLTAVAITASNYSSIAIVYTGTSISNLTSVLSATFFNGTFYPVAGQSYTIEVFGTGGNFTLNIQQTQPPANDNFASRQSLTGLNPSVQGTTYSATFEPQERSVFSEPFFASEGSVWYSWTAPADGPVEASCSANFEIFTGNAVSNLTAVVPTSSGTVTFQAVAGQEYEIGIAGPATTPGAFTLSLFMSKVQFASPTNGDAFPFPANIPIVARTIDLDAPVVSVSFYANGNLLATVTNAPFQFDYTNVPAGSYTLSLQATDVNGIVWTNFPIEVRSEPSNDNFTNRFVITDLSTNIVADNSGATTETNEYLPGGATGRTLWWSWTAPTNGMLTINSGGFFPVVNPVTFPILPPLPVPNATTNSAQPDDIVITGPTGPFGPPGPTTGPLIAVYTNSVLTNLDLYATNSGFYASGFISIDPITGQLIENGQWFVLTSFNFTVVGGQTYQISLDGVNGSYGQASMGFNFAPTPPPPTVPGNDNFAQRYVLTGSSATTNGTTIAATHEPGEPLSSPGLNTGTVWYSWTAPASGDVQVLEQDSFYYYYSWLSSLDIGVYAGSDLTALVPITSGGGSVSFYALAGETYQIDVGNNNGLQLNFVLTVTGQAGPPTLASVRLPDKSYQITVNGAVGQSFVVQFSTNGTTWQTIRTDTLLSGSLQFVDAASAGHSGPRDYRVVSLDSLAAEPPFGIVGFGLQSGAGFSLHLTGNSGQPFRLQTTTNFSDWSDLTSGTLVNQAFDFTDANASQFDHRFYRALKQ